MKACCSAAMAVGFLVVVVPTGLDSCSIAPPTAIFATSQRPADVSGQFLKGRLGVLQRSYEKKYLIAAFRILSRAPLTEEEADSLLESSAARGRRSGWIARRQRSGLLRGSISQICRLQIGFDPYKTVTLKGLQYSFLNCQSNAFETANETLESLGAEWGFDDPKTLEWATAQDQVFANCSASKATIPASASGGMDPRLAAHRSYQIAAACFYAGDFRKAAERFKAIAKEKGSPWREIAPYLAARALLRAGLVNGDRDAIQRRQGTNPGDPPTTPGNPTGTSRARNCFKIWQVASGT